MTETPSVDAPKKNNVLYFVFITVSLVLSISCLVFYSLWRASEVTCAISSTQDSQSSTTGGLVEAILPTTKPPAPSFIYPPSGDEKNNWSPLSANFQKEIAFKMALPKNLPYSKALSNYNQMALTYLIFENLESKQTSLACEKKFIEWQKKSQTNPEIGMYTSCKPDDSALFTISFDTTTESADSEPVKSSTYRDWSLSELVENSEFEQYYMVSTTQLIDSRVSIRVSLNWPNKEALEKTELLLGYDSKTLLNNLISQMNFGEHGIYGKTF